MPGVERVAVGTVVPWRDAGGFFGAQFTVQGYVKANGEEDPRARFRTVSPGFFASLGVPIVAGRDFTEADRRDAERVVIISASVARRMFPTGDALNRGFKWTDPVIKFIGVSGDPPDRRRRRRCRRRERRARTRHEHLPPVRAGDRGRPALRPGSDGSVHAGGADHADHSRAVADQPVERAATLEDVRAEVLSPERLNTLVFGGFAAVALTIAVVGVAGVLAFSVSARTREFGIRMAIGSAPRQLLTRILGEGRRLPASASLQGRSGGWRSRGSSAPTSRTSAFQGFCPRSAPRRSSSPRRSSRR